MVEEAKWKSVTEGVGQLLSMKDTYEKLCCRKEHLPSPHLATAASSIEFTHDMQAYSVLANSEESNPALTSCRRLSSCAGIL